MIKFFLKIFFVCCLVIFLGGWAEISMATKKITSSNFVINNDEQQYGIYEIYKDTHMPEGWEFVDDCSLEWGCRNSTTTKKEVVLKTPFGDCSDYSNNNIKKCCESLGFEYINFRGIDITINRQKIRDKRGDNGWTCYPIKRTLGEGIFVNESENKCTDYFSIAMRDVSSGKIKTFDADEEECFVADDGWQEYGRLESFYTFSLNTPLGECEKSGNSMYSIKKDCLEELGYENIGQVEGKEKKKGIVEIFISTLSNFLEDVKIFLPFYDT